MKRYYLLAGALLFSAKLWAQNDVYTNRIDYVIDQLERIFTYDNMEEIKLSVYFKNEDNGQVNLGYIRSNQGKIPY